MTTIAHIEECVFNWRKGLWQTPSYYWNVRHTQWIVIAFLWPTLLERGVRS